MAIQRLQTQANRLRGGKEKDLLLPLLMMLEGEEKEEDLDGEEEEEQSLLFFSGDNDKSLYGDMIRRSGIE